MNQTDRILTTHVGSLPRVTPVGDGFSIAQSSESSFRLGGSKVRRSRVPPLGLDRIGHQTLDVQAHKLVRIVSFG